ncbi:MAG TPA: TonB family protein [Pyrinomonadaceae bacterium]|nr:TonB family protein [Pyrinomonadaceae bacterium]
MKMILSIFTILIFSFCIYGQNANTSTAQADRPLKILKKPQASPGRCGGGAARTRVRVTFDRSGTVTGTELTMPSPCSDFNERSLAAARRIKFEPAIRDGQPITVTRLVEYLYRRY